MLSRFVGAVLEPAGAGDIEAQQQAHAEFERLRDSDPVAAAAAHEQLLKARQAAIAAQVEGGHAGIEVHSHFMGNVDPTEFRKAIQDSGRARRSATS